MIYLHLFTKNASHLPGTTLKYIYIIIVDSIADISCQVITGKLAVKMRDEVPALIKFIF